MLFGRVSQIVIDCRLHYFFIYKVLQPTLQTDKPKTCKQEYAYLICAHLRLKSPCTHALPCSQFLLWGNMSGFETFVGGGACQVFCRGTCQVTCRGACQVDNARFNCFLLIVKHKNRNVNHQL